LVDLRDERRTGLRTVPAAVANPDAWRVSRAESRSDTAVACTIPAERASIATTKTATLILPLVVKDTGRGRLL